MNAEAFNQSTTVFWFLCGILGIRPIGADIMSMVGDSIPVGEETKTMREDLKPMID
jgi:hypothetical protein